MAKSSDKGEAAELGWGRIHLWTDVFPEGIQVPAEAWDVPWDGHRQRGCLERDIDTLTALVLVNAAEGRGPGGPA